MTQIHAELQKEPIKLLLQTVFVSGTNTRYCVQDKPYKG